MMCAARIYLSLCTERLKGTAKIYLFVMKLRWAAMCFVGATDLFQVIADRRGSREKLCNSNINKLAVAVGSYVFCGGDGFVSSDC